MAFSSGSERDGPSGGLAMGACDAVKGFADSRMAGVQRMLRDPVRPGDGGNPPP